MPTGGGVGGHLESTILTLALESLETKLHVPHSAGAAKHKVIVFARCEHTSWLSDVVHLCCCHSAVRLFNLFL